MKHVKRITRCYGIKKQKPRCRHSWNVVRDSDGDYKVCGKCRKAVALRTVH